MVEKKIPAFRRITMQFVIMKLSNLSLMSKKKANQTKV